MVKMASCCSGIGCRRAERPAPSLQYPKGAVPPPKPILEERFNLGTAFSVTPVTAGVSGALLLLVIAVFAFLLFRFGRDRRYRGSAVDQANCSW